MTETAMTATRININDVCKAFAIANRIRENVEKKLGEPIFIKVDDQDFYTDESDFYTDESDSSIDEPFILDDMLAKDSTILFLFIKAPSDEKSDVIESFGLTYTELAQMNDIAISDTISKVADYLTPSPTVIS